MAVVGYREMPSWRVSATFNRLQCRRVARALRRLRRSRRRRRRARQPLPPQGRARQTRRSLTRWVRWVPSCEFGHIIWGSSHGPVMSCGVRLVRLVRQARLCLRGAELVEPTARHIPWLVWRCTRRVGGPSGVLVFSVWDVGDCLRGAELVIPGAAWRGRERCPVWGGERRAGAGERQMVWGVPSVPGAVVHQVAGRQSWLYHLGGCAWVLWSGPHRSEASRAVNSMTV